MNLCTKWYVSPGANDALGRVKRSWSEALGFAGSIFRGLRDSEEPWLKDFRFSARF